MCKGVLAFVNHTKLSFAEDIFDAVVLFEVGEEAQTRYNRIEKCESFGIWGVQLNCLTISSQLDSKSLCVMLIILLLWFLRYSFSSTTVNVSSKRKTCPCSSNMMLWLST